MSLIFCYRLSVLILFLSLINFIPGVWWLKEVNSSFLPFYLLLHLLIIIFLLFFLVKELKTFNRRLLVFFLLVNLAIFTNYTIRFSELYFEKDNSKEFAKKNLTVLYSNLYFRNKNPEFLKIISDKNPDLVFVNELNTFWAQELSARYPYSEIKLGHGVFSLGVYSKFPIEKVIYKEVGEGLPPVLKLKFSSPIEIEAVLFHAMPPLSHSFFRKNKLLIRRMATGLKHSSSNLIVAGDLNLTQFSYYYKMMTKMTGLKDAMAGQGWKSTWKIYEPFFYFTLDYVFYKGDMFPIEREVLDTPGSDHRAVLVKFNLLNNVG